MKIRLRARGLVRWMASTLCIAIVSVYAVSGWFGFGVEMENETRDYRIRAVVGLIEWERAEKPQTFTVSMVDYPKFRTTTSRILNAPAFEWSIRLRRKYVASSGATTTVWSAPLWLLLVPSFSVAGLLWWKRYLNRFGLGCCPKCGYSLAGLGTAAGRDEVCPECGAAVSKNRA